ncbi:MAG: hypothetical protein ACE366_16585 [Bradymonadia bacterium]
MTTDQCPSCGAHQHRVVYYGLPHRLCSNEQCSRLDGWPCVLTEHLPFTGRLLVYVSPYVRNYWRALWSWLKGVG